MARFTTRVELLDVAQSSKSGYEKLQIEMAKENFTRTIIITKIKTQLPEAEYNKEGAYTKEQVLASAKTAAAHVTKDFSILVTESKEEPGITLNNPA